MLKTISAALLAVSIFAAPALASNVRGVHGNPMGANARLMNPVVKTKPVWKQVRFFSHRHHKVHRHFHRHHHHHR